MEKIVFYPYIFFTVSKENETTIALRKVILINLNNYLIKEIKDRGSPSYTRSNSLFCFIQSSFGKNGQE